MSTAHHLGRWAATVMVLAACTMGTAQHTVSIDHDFSDWTDVEIVQTCQQEAGSPDLRTEDQSVRAVLSAHLNSLVSAGVSGFASHAGPASQAPPLTADDFLRPWTATTTDDLAAELSADDLSRDGGGRGDALVVREGGDGGDRWGEVRSGEVGRGQARTGEDRRGQVRTGEDR